MHNSGLPGLDTLNSYLVSEVWPGIFCFSFKQAAETPLQGAVVSCLDAYNLQCTNE